MLSPQLVARASVALRYLLLALCAALSSCNTPAVNRLLQLTEAQGCVKLSQVTPTTKLDPNFRICASELVVVTVGSISMPSLRAAQELTIGKHVSLAVFDEQDFTRPCMECDLIHHKADPLLYHDTARRSWVHTKGRAWSCAQQRIAAAYRDAILHTAELDPRWLFFGDADTSIDPVQLALYLKDKDANAPVYAGFAHGNFLNGGAGFAVSRFLLNELRAEVRVASYKWQAELNETDVHVRWVHARDNNVTFIVRCVDEIFGGPLCFFHSDWVMGHCIAAVGYGVTHDDKSRFHQDAPRECTTTRQYVACHHMDAEAQMERYRSLVKQYMTLR